MKTVKHISKVGRILFCILGIGIMALTSCAKEKDCDCDGLTVTIKQGKCEDLELSNGETVKCK